MRTVLHIGMNKTGSTSLQNALYENRQLLGKQKILYPLAGCGVKGSSKIFHYELSRALGYSNTPAGTENNPDKIRAQLEAEIAENAPEVLLLSSEYFCLRRDISRLRAFLSGHDLTVVVYLRRHDFWYASLYAQAIKSIPCSYPWRAGFTGYVEWLSDHPDHYNSYGDLLDHWRVSFPEANIIVRPLEQALDGDQSRETKMINMIKDFFYQISVPLPKELEYVEARRDNCSISHIDLQRAEMTRRAELGEVVNEFKIFSQLTSAEPVQQVVRAQTKDYARIAKSYLGHSVKPLFALD